MFIIIQLSIIQLVYINFHIEIAGHIRRKIHRFIQSNLHHKFIFLPRLNPHLQLPFMRVRVKQANRLNGLPKDLGFKIRAKNPETNPKFAVAFQDNN